jgi:predicted kinase
MRKWMSERIKRRKKDPQEDPAKPQQAPLQPAYFDGAAPTSSPATDPKISNNEARIESSEFAEESPHHAAGDSLAPVSTETPQDSAVRAPVVRSNSDPRTRRRRGRGGRGRGGSRSTASPRANVPTNTGENVSSDQAGSQPTEAIAPQVISPPKGTVILAIGLPGSGKSSWFKRHNISPLSSDLLRTLLFDDATEQRFQDLVFSNLRSMLKARLIARRPLNYVDATNLTSHDRRGWIKLARDYGYEVHGLYFDVPLDVCLERNRKRQRVVAEDVMRRMAAKQKPPSFEEGFTKITVVRVKPKDAPAS